MSTPEEIEVGRRNLVAELKQMLRRKDLDEYPLDAQTVRDLVEVLEAAEPYLTGGRCWLRTGLEAIIQEAEDAATDEIPFADLIAPEKLRALLAHHSEVES